jgi:UDP-glucose 4-epimerase
LGFAASDSILVVGAGFIGTAVARAFSARGRRVSVLTRGGTVPFCDDVDRLIVGDARRSTVLAAALEHVGDVIYCAGGSLPVEAERDPDAELQRETEPLLAVLEALRHRPNTRLFLISSGGTVYGEPARVPVDENHPLNPRTAYAAIKVASERHLDSYRQVHGVKATVLRCANVYGPGQLPYRTQGVVATLLASAASGRPVVIFGDGSAVRDYIYVDDATQAIADLVELADVPPVLNLGSGVGTRLDTLIELVERTVGRKLRTHFEPVRPTDLHRVVLDVGRLRELVPLDPTTMIDGMRMAWQLERAIDADAS